MSTQLLDTSKLEAQLERMKQDSQGGIPADMPHYDTPFEKFHKYVANVKSDLRYVQGTTEYRKAVDDKLYSKLTDYYSKNKLSTEIPSKEDFTAGNFIKQDDKKNSAFAPVALVTTGLTEATARLAKVATKGAMKTSQVLSTPTEKMTEEGLKYFGHGEDASYLSTVYNKFWEENNKVPAKIGDVADTLHSFGDQYSNGGIKDEFLYRGGGEMIATWPLFGPINKAAAGLKALPLLSKAIPVMERTPLGKMAIARLENAAEGYMFGVASGSENPSHDAAAFAGLGLVGDAVLGATGFQKNAAGELVWRGRKFFSQVAATGGKPLVDEVLQAASADVKVDSETAQKLVDTTKDIIQKTQKAYPRASKKQVLDKVAEIAAKGSDQAIVEAPDLVAAKVDSEFNKVASQSKDLQAATDKVAQFAKSVGDDSPVTAASTERIVEGERLRTGRKNPKKAADSLIQEGTSETLDKSVASSLDKKTESLTRVKKAIASAKELQDAGDKAGGVAKSLSKVEEVSGSGLPMTEKVTAAMDDSYNQKEQVYKLAVGAARLNSFEFSEGLLNMLGVNMKMASKHKLLTLWGLKDEAKAFLGSQGLNGNIQKAFEDSLLDAVRGANKRPNLTAEEATVAANKLVEKHLSEMTRTGHLPPNDKRGVFGSSNFFDAATVWQKLLQSESENQLAVAKKLAKKLKNNPSAAQAVGDIIDKIEAEAKNKPKPGPGAANTFDPAFGQNPNRQLTSGLPGEWIKTLALTKPISHVLDELPTQWSITDIGNLNNSLYRSLNYYPDNVRNTLEGIVQAYNTVPHFRRVADALSHYTYTADVAATISNATTDMIKNTELNWEKLYKNKRFIGTIEPGNLASKVPTIGGEVDVSMSDAIKDAKILLDESRKAPQVQKTLYRGLSTDTPIEAFENAKVGQEFAIDGLRSFSSDYQQAENFIKSYHQKKYILQILPGAQAIKVGPFTHYPTEQELLTQGLFDVVDVHPDEIYATRKVIVLKPKAVF